MGVPIKDGWSADNFESGTQAALHGGVTTIIDFSILKEQQSLIDSIDSRLAEAETSHCDFHLHANITRLDDKVIADIPNLFRAGITSFKVFTTYKEAGMMLTYEQIGVLAGVLADHGGLLMVHAEDDAETAAASQPLIQRGLTEPHYHGISRPASSEAAAIKNIARITTESGCPTYIVHLSSAAGLDTAAEYPELLLETCPQYLLLNESAYKKDDGRMYVASPPLRQAGDCDALWEGIKNQQILTLGTDHCPFNLADKKPGLPFNKIPNGMGGVETLFPVMLAQYIARGMELSELTALLSTNSARIFELYPRKGCLAPGSDADIVVVDPEKTTADWDSSLESNSDWNAYRDFQAIFPELVMRRGEKMVENGVHISQGYGKFLPAIRPAGQS